MNFFRKLKQSLFPNKYLARKQLAELQKLQHTLNSENTSIQSKITSIHSDISTLRSEITSILRPDGDIDHDLSRTIVIAAYKQILHRYPSAPEQDHWINRIRTGLLIGDLFSRIKCSDEATRVSEYKLGPKVSDGHFIMNVAPLLLGRGISANEVVLLQRLLNEEPYRRETFVIDRINEYLEKARGTKPDITHDGRCIVMGTTIELTHKAWKERGEKLGLAKQIRLGKPVESKAFKHKDVFKVSMIASLYKGGKYIDSFLKNITSQTLFHCSELIIIDANSPDNERDIIEEYQKTYPNIVYKRINYRIGIYEAWNTAVELARGEYLTNTNLDDLRRFDSIELQASHLDNNKDVDIVYQDFYYTLNPFLSCEEIAAYNFKSELPIITPHNLMLFNSPHNAPMWRATLHKDLGLFDTQFRSAGDYEFWARCLSKGKRFRKINSPHIAYYQNPEGISTRPNTTGVQEYHHILSLYSHKLTNSALLQSRGDFIKSLGSSAAATLPTNTSYYDLTQAALVSLSGRYPSVRKTIANELPLRVVIDGVIFQLGEKKLSEAWNTLLSHLVNNQHLSLFMLNRGSAPTIPGLTLVDFPSYGVNAYNAADSLLIQEFCDKLNIDVFTSTFYTTATTTPQVQMVYEPALEPFKSPRMSMEKQLALTYSSGFAFVSQNTYSDLLNINAHLARSRSEIMLPGLDTIVSKADLNSLLSWENIVPKLQELLFHANHDTGDDEWIAFRKEWKRLRIKQGDVDVGE